MSEAGEPHTSVGRVRREKKKRLSPVSLSLFSLFPDLLFDCSRVLEYAEIRTVLQSKTKSRLSAGSLRTNVGLVALPITVAIYRNREEIPVMRWSFEMGIEGKSEKMLFDFIFRVRTVFMVDCSTDCLRMVTDVSPLALCPLHLTERSAEFKRYTTLTASARVNQVKALLGTTAQTQGPQDTVSTVVLEDEKRILQALKEIKDLLSQHAPQLLEVFKMKSLLTPICENFFSEMRADDTICHCSSSLTFDLAGP